VRHLPEHVVDREFVQRLRVEPRFLHALLGQRDELRGRVERERHQQIGIASEGVGHGRLRLAVAAPRLDLVEHRLHGLEEVDVLDAGVDGRQVGVHDVAIVLGGPAAPQVTEVMGRQQKAGNCRLFASKPATQASRSGSG
jgi:hypothetical protein